MASVNIKWTPAIEDSLSQEVQYKEATSTTWITAIKLSPTDGDETITDLKENTLYDFRIVNNCVGGNVPSKPIQVVSLVCPTVTVTSTESTVAYSLTGSPLVVKNYTIQLLDNNNTLLQTQTKTAGSIVNGTFTSLSASTNYKVKVILNSTVKTQICNAVSIQTKSAPLKVKWIIDPSESYCELQLTADETGILVVDIFNTGNAVQLYSKINTPGVSQNSLRAYTGKNFMPENTAGSPDQAIMLASDYVTDSSSLDWRFEFNVAKLLALYPNIDLFTFEVRGSSATTLNVTGAYSIKGADQGNMSMLGSPGNYIPSNINTNNLSSVNTNYTIPNNVPNGTYNNYPLVCTFTYNRTTKVLSKL